MMLKSVRLTLKQHRFEVGAAALAALVLGFSALVVVYRLNAVNVPPGCFEAWLSGGGAEGAGACAGPVQTFATINEEEAGKVLAAMAVLPFAVGLLGGVPLVGREIEARTAQTAWFLTGSRVRWLVRQLSPVLVLLIAAVTFAALAASVLEQTREAWYHSALSDMSLHGPIVVARAFGALGLGLLVGALVGRTLPAFIIGTALSLVVIAIAGGAQWQWLEAQKTVVRPDAREWRGITMGNVWVAPDGTQLTDREALSRAPSTAGDPYAWLASEGYQQRQLGVPESVALQWAPYDIVGFTVLGVALLAASAVVVDRRRP
jgi:hypothetical protein